MIAGQDVGQFEQRVHNRLRTRSERIEQAMAPVDPGDLHAGDMAIAVVARQSDYAGLGVDVEELSRGPSPRAARLICRPREMEWVDNGSGTERLAMLFSAKEAVFKALYPIQHIWLGFGDAELTWRPERCAFEARLLKSPGEGFPADFVMEVHCSLTTTQVLSTAACYS